MLLAACGTGEAAPPRVVPPPSSLRVGDTWNATVRASKPKAFVIASGRERRSFPLVRRGRAYHARVTFPHAGRWRYGVRLARTEFVGAVVIGPRRITLLEPFDVVEEAGGSFLVADRSADIVYRLRDRDLRVVARVPRPRDLEPVPDGHVLVASGPHVLSLDPVTGSLAVVETAEKDVLGVTRLSDGSLVASDFGDRVVTFEDGSEKVLAEGLAGVHGLLATALGVVICESTTGRVLRLKPDGQLEVLAQGLALPSFAASAPGGALYLAEFGAGRISRLDPSGTVTPVATISSPTAISVALDGSILATASLDGRVARIDPATGRVSWLY
jgi:PQQ-like domain